MNAATITDASFTVENANGPVAGVITYESATRTATSGVETPAGGVSISSSSGEGADIFFRILAQQYPLTTKLTFQLTPLCSYMHRSRW